ncbi:hypothetical protein BDK51DRAFT_53195 [Blyttiomyces helicus]|uniref:Uncharacterized protein n=1 Tax=Blyttiomyces helicus TaxID=388810 RepID=A0A4P9W5K9_9FUNG|nr:hypothetical protein BDK51DRAFT_53195 [Blyttiomyces helicus]|eukprot:RKO87242.1 hypothetical protein BDK51DRAFT_53195 [Blyttiomyces helicus]
MPRRRDPTPLDTSLPPGSEQTSPLLFSPISASPSPTALPAYSPPATPANNDVAEFTVKSDSPLFGPLDAVLVALWAAGVALLVCGMHALGEGAGIRPRKAGVTRSRPTGVPLSSPSSPHWCGYTSS